MFETWSFNRRFLHVINARTILLEKLLCCSLSTFEEQRRILKEPTFSVKKSHVKSVSGSRLLLGARLQDMLVELQPSNDAVKADPWWLEVVVHELRDQIMTKS